MKIFNNTKNNTLFFVIIIFIIILKFFNSPYNLYSVLNWSYDERMQQNYGYCKNESWGFYNFVIKNFNLNGKSIKIINDEGYITLENLFNIKKSNTSNPSFVLILNYTSEDNESILNGKYNFLKNYKIKHRFNNCYLLEIND